MTNTNLLKQQIQTSGYKLSFLASQLGLSSYGFSLKVNGEREFKASEISKLCELLNITSLTEREKIFFAH